MDLRPGEAEEANLVVSGGRRGGVRVGGEVQCGLDAGGVTELRAALGVAGRQPGEGGAARFEVDAGEGVLLCFGVLAGVSGDEPLCATDSGGEPGVAGEVGAGERAAGVGHRGAGVVQVKSGVREDAARAAGEVVQLGEVARSSRPLLSRDEPVA